MQQAAGSPRARIWHLLYYAPLIIALLYTHLNSGHDVRAHLAVGEGDMLLICFIYTYGASRCLFAYIYIYIK